MLKNDLYRITATDMQVSTIQATLRLFSGHQIFAGHFPGQPILPGACILNIVQEVLSLTLKASYQLKKADNLKFISPIDPKVTPELEIKLIYKSIEAGIQVTASLSADKVVCFKMQGLYSHL